MKILARRVGFGEALGLDTPPAVRMTSDHESNVNDFYKSFPLGAMHSVAVLLGAGVVYNSNSQYHHYQFQKTSVLHVLNLFILSPR